MSEKFAECGEVADALSAPLVNPVFEESASEADLWPNVLRLLRKTYEASCVAVISVGHETFDVVEFDSDTWGDGSPGSCRPLQWSVSLVEALRDATERSNAIFHNGWVALRVRHFVAWPAVFLVFDQNARSTSGAVDTAAFYHIEYLLSQILDLREAYSELLFLDSDGEHCGCFVDSRV